MLIWFWVQYLPGYFLSRALVPKAEGLTRHILALVCGFSVIPLGLFMLGGVTEVPLDSPYLWSAATAINLGGFFVLVPPQQWRTPDVGKWDSLAVLATFLLSSALLLLGFRAIDAGDALTTIQHCLYVIALHGIQNDPSVSLPLYDHLTGDFAHFLINHDTSGFNGLAELLFEQRIGNVPLLGPPVALFGTAGWFIASVQATVITGLCIFMAAQAAGATRRSAIAAAAIFVWCSHIFCAYYLNENYFALALVSFLMWATIEDKLTLGWVTIMGFVGGHLVGVRHTSVLFLPALALGIMWSSATVKDRLKQLGIATLCATIATLPWLYINAVMLGNPFTHPKIQVDSGGRVVQNVFFGTSFMFKPLNWPFTDQVVRTVWNPFPTFVWLPLLASQCFGQLATALATIGAIGLRKSRRTLTLLLMFAVPHWLAISWLEGLDWEQISYAAPGLAPFGVALALGFDSLKGKRPALIALGVAAIIAVASYGCRYIDVPTDTRILNAELWPTAPGPDKGTDSVKQRLTAFSPLPDVPHFRTSGVKPMWSNMAALLNAPDIPIVDELPVYPSGQVVVLSAYSKRTVRSYDFEVSPRELRTPDVPVRTAVWLHTLSFQFKAERLRVHVERLSGRYKINVTPIGTSDQAQDFTFRLNPWYPPIKSIEVTLDEKPFKGLRVLDYGGTIDDGERMMVATNYPKEIIDVVEVPYEVISDEPVNCGIWIFLANVDGQYIETLSPGGAFDMKWSGKTKGTLRLPRNLLADTVVLFSEPYCSDHIPQYGDRFGIAKAPFSPKNGIQIKLDQIW